MDLLGSIIAFSIAALLFILSWNFSKRHIIIAKVVCSFWITFIIFLISDHVNGYKLLAYWLCFILISVVIDFYIKINSMANEKDFEHYKSLISKEVLTYKEQKKFKSLEKRFSKRSLTQ